MAKRTKPLTLAEIEKMKREIAEAEAIAMRAEKDKGPAKQKYEALKLKAVEIADELKQMKEDYKKTYGEPIEPIKSRTKKKAK